MEKNQFNQFIKTICKHFGKRQILVGSQIFDTIVELEKEEKSNFIFIKCDLLEDRVIIFGDKYPLANRAVLIDDIIAFDKYIDEINYTMIAFTNIHDENNITVRTLDGKMTMIQLENNEIKFQQLLN